MICPKFIPWRTISYHKQLEPVERLPGLQLAIFFVLFGFFYFVFSIFFLIFNNSKRLEKKKIRIIIKKIFEKTAVKLFFCFVFF